MFRYYEGMNAYLDEVCADFSADQLQVIADFLQGAAAAGRRAAAEFSDPR